MPQRPPTLADRLRTAWRRTGEPALVSTGAPQEDSGRHAGNDFADRLRAAVRTRR